MTNTFSIKEALLFGWETFKKDPWFYIGVTGALGGFSIIVNALTGHGHGLFAFVGFLIGLVASTVVTIAFVRLALSAHGGQHVGWEGLWAPQHFLRMLGATLIQSIVVTIGFILLIVPGLIAREDVTLISYQQVGEQLQNFRNVLQAPYHPATYPSY